MPFSDPVLIFATVMVLILLSPLLARRMRLPEIVGLILAGMLAGEHGFGLLARDATIKLLGNVGLLLIMFLCGVEIDLHQVRRHRSHSLVFGLLTFAIPLALGTLLGQWVLGMAVPTAVLMASMFSSHTLLTFPIVGRFGLTKSRAVTTTIGGTIITDTLALLVLAVIAAGTVGDLGGTFWALLTTKIVVFMLAVLYLVPRIGRWFLRNFSADENVEFVSVLAIAFTVSYLAHLAGLEPIIGAFMAGLTLNSLIPEKGGLMAKLHFTGNALFIPFFLLSVGMLVNVELLWQGLGTWKVIGVMVPVALLSKWLAAKLAGAGLKYSAAESGLIYGLSVNQAAATLAAALVGYDIGLFDDGVITGTIVMIGVTCFIGPLVTEKFGRLLAASARKGFSESVGSPQRVMLPVTSRDNCRDLLELAFFLRAEGSHEPLYPVNVVFEGPDAELDIARGEKLMAHLVIRALSVNVPISPLTVVETNVPAGILRAARENRISIINLFWNGANHSRSRVFGQIVDRVIEGSSQLLLISRLVHPPATSRRILLLCPPLANLQPGFVQALAAVKTIARQSGVKLLVMAPEDAMVDFEEYVGRTKPSVSLEYRAYRHWKSVGAAVTAEAGADDWIVVMEARIGRIAWQPSSDRLPRQLQAALPDNNLSFIYPPEDVGEQTQNIEKLLEQGIVSQILDAEHCLFVAGTGKLRDLLEQLPASYLRQRNIPPEGIVGKLVELAEHEPVDLVPGVALLHEYCDEVDDSEDRTPADAVGAPPDFDPAGSDGSGSGPPSGVLGEYRQANEDSGVCGGRATGAVVR